MEVRSEKHTARVQKLINAHKIAVIKSKEGCDLSDVFEREDITKMHFRETVLKIGFCVLQLRRRSCGLL
jgi:hypothetical protein